MPIRDLANPTRFLAFSGRLLPWLWAASAVGASELVASLAAVRRGARRECHAIERHPAGRAEQRPLAVAHRREGAGLVAGSRGLDLDHFCAEIGKGERGRRPGQDPREIQHADARVVFVVFAQ